MKPIEEVRKGDWVWSVVPETGDPELKQVEDVFVNETDEIVHVRYGDTEIDATPTHPFYTPDRGWVSAVNLRAGDRLQLLNGEYVVVEQVQHEILESPVKVYNFEVQGNHTYYVGGDDDDSAVLVHNKCGNPGGRHGGSKHRQKIENIKTALENRGFKVSDHEIRVKVNDSGKYRYPDITATKNGRRYYIQVGKATKSGRPIARELRALKDLKNAKEIGKPLFFPYNK